MHTEGAPAPAMGVPAVLQAQLDAMPRLVSVGVDVGGVSVDVG